jgi:uncharacterized protein
LERQRRRCVCCRATAGKYELLRFVCEFGGVLWDERQSLPGRGAYMHAWPACWEVMTAGGRWEHALRLPKGSLREEQLRTLQEDLKNRIEGLVKGGGKAEGDRSRKIRL